MKTAFATDFKSYAVWLTRFGIAYQEDDIWLQSTGQPGHNNWSLSITVKTRQIAGMLEAVLPFLAETKVSFRIIKNEMLHYQLNGGHFGGGLVGKVLTIFPATEQLAVTYANALTPLTNNYAGPVVLAGIQLGNALFATTDSSKPHGNGRSLFKPSKKYRVKPKRILGGAYIPFQLMREAPKGNIFKAINVKKLRLTTCLIKQGRANMLDDDSDRDMKDRLLWEKTVLENLYGKARVPAVIDFFEDDGGHYLIMEFLEGQALDARLNELCNKKPWKDLDNNSRYILLRYYSEVLSLIADVHHNGYIHRDITENNFIVLPSGELSVIDFEISYSVKNDQPDPPFILGTHGYVSPEQQRYCLPTTKEDIYSLGALLLYFVTGIPPKIFIEENRDKVKEKLAITVANPNLSAIILKCLNSNPSERPGIPEMKKVISEQMEKLQCSSDN